MNLPGKYNEVTTELIENNNEKELLIQSLKYLPKIFQDKDLFKDASKLLDACLSEEEDVLAQIHQAYCDTLYKISAYQQLSYGAKKALLKEKGFEYVLDLLKHIYEDRYNQLPEYIRKQKTLEQYLEEQTKNNLANLTMLFNLLYILKGKTLGLELALQLVNCPEFIYLTWDIVANYKGELDSWDDLPLDAEAGDAYTVSLDGELKTDAIFNGVTWHKCTRYQDYLTPRQPFTADLTIWGIASSSLQANIAKFVRSYMLPFVEIKLNFTDSVDPVLAYPSGDRSLLRSFNLVHYFTEHGLLVKHQLEHTVSQNGWEQAGQLDLPITMGQPIYNENGFKGEVDLNVSYVERDGVKHYLYGHTKTIPDFVTGDALDSLDEEGRITFDNDYVQVPLEMDYVLVDIETGDQINPYWTEDEFIRDSIIKYNTNLTVGGIHLNKTVNEMNWDGFGDEDYLLIEDFDKYIEEEVYAGRVTNVIAENPAGVMIIETTNTYVREKTGIEGPFNLRFTDAFVNDNYTGIGDLGILGSNTYFIYNGMLFQNNEGIKQVGTDNTWTDIGATHPVSNTYYTPGINNGKLVYVKGGEVFDLPRSSNLLAYPDAEEKERIAVDNLEDDIENEDLEDEELRSFEESWIKIADHWYEDEADKWEMVTGYVNDYYTAFAICAGSLYRIFIKDGVLSYEILDEGGWQYITGSFYPNTYKAYGIKNNKLYTIGDTITELKVDGHELVGWDPSIDCVSRYHQSNEDYTSYGICNGLYAINNETLTLLDSGNWTKICGFYNDKSPRTFGYGIKNGNLYELQGNDIVLKDSNGWTDITGCTTSTNTFVMGIKDGYLYKINAKTLTKMSEDNGWTDVFGRYTTSTALNNNCYGYGIRNGRLHVFNIEDDTIVPGMWKLDGEGPEVNLHDYNIEDIAVQIGGQTIEGIENVKTHVPVGDEDVSTYDIIVSYETIGFEDNTRYQVKTEMTGEYKTYISPEYCREYIYMDNAPEFDTTTSYISNFTNCPLVIHGRQKITGDGEAFEFAFHQSYLEIPRFYTTYVDEHGFEHKVEKPLTKGVFKVGCVITDEFLPLITDDNNNGIFYGLNNNKYGIFVKNNEITRIIPVAQNDHKEFYIQLDSTFTISYSLDGINYTNTNLTMDRPNYLGGNEYNIGDGIIFLADSYIEITYGLLERLPLYQYGKYMSVDSLGLDIVQRFITDSNQETQKVIEIQDLDKNPLIDFYMDKLYISRNTSCSNVDLDVTDNFCYNNLNIGEEEERTTSTLTYSGAYTLDAEKAKPRGNISTSYRKDGIAKNFNENDYIDIDPDETITFKTGSNVNSQLLLSTEEHNAYTNQYLLIADLNARYNNTELTKNKRKQKHVVPSGVIYEENTQAPGTVTKNLECNVEAFEIDDTKINRYDQYTFDSYTAYLSNFQPMGLTTTYCDIYLNLTGTDVFDVKPILNFKTNTAIKQKIAQIGYEDVIVGNIDVIDIDVKDWFTMEEEVLTPMEEHPVWDEEQHAYIYQDEALTFESAVVIDNITYSVYTNETTSFYLHEYTIQEEVLDPDAYPWEANKDYWLKMSIEREEIGVSSNITLHETSSPEPKDRFIIENGVISNFSEENYILTKTLTDDHGLLLYYMTDDDVSKDQGLFGLPDGQSVCIKDNHFCLCDENGNILERSDQFFTNGDSFYLLLANDPDKSTKLNKAHIYYAHDLQYRFEPLFEETIDIQDVMYIGYADTGVEPTCFNGSIDLTKSWLEDGGRLYDYTQTNHFEVSEDGTNFTPLYDLVNYFKVDKLFFGYEFTGQLDMYGSDLLLPYTLTWLENRVKIDTVIKQVKQSQDPSYDPDLDPNTYGVEEYGIHAKNPKRWDTLTINYVTEDKAYYLRPNTTYYLKCNVEQDENGKCLLTTVNEPTWNSGIVSFENGYFTWEPEGYIVLNVETTTEDQTLCSMNDGQKLCIKDGKWCFFDDTNYHEIGDVTPIASFKLKFDGSKIIYNNTETIVEGFIGYHTLTIGNGFKGTLNLNTSYIVTDHQQYLFTPYKRITPLISTDNVNWSNITIEPMLSINMLSFGKQFNGTVDLLQSNLIEDDCTYWLANQVNVYAKYDMPEDDIHKDELVRSVIRDSITVDTDKYWTANEIVRINPEDLSLIVEGKPLVDDVITMNYTTQYMFRLNNREYDFNVKYKDRLQFTYTDLESNEEFLIYETDPQRILFNVGYNYWGTISLKDSTRGGMMMCEYLLYNTYTIFYRKYGELDWLVWNTFSKESRFHINQRTGFDLNGPLYMETSYVKMGNLITPFLTNWDGTFITVVGGPSIVDGIATEFSENDYLVIRENSLQDDDIISFTVTFKDLQNQGIGTGFYVKDEAVCSNDVELQKIYDNYKLIIEYYIKDGKATARIIGDNSTNFELGKAKAHVLTIIPYNENYDEQQPGYYIESEEEAEQLQISYRVGTTYYDHYKPPIMEWHPVQLEKQEIRYFGKDLNVYVANIPLGYTFDPAGNPINTNPDGIQYLDNEDIEYKIISPVLTTTNKTVLYSDKLEKQRTQL